MGLKNFHKKSNWNLRALTCKVVIFVSYHWRRHREGVGTGSPFHPIRAGTSYCICAKRLSCLEEVVHENLKMNKRSLLGIDAATGLFA